MIASKCECGHGIRRHDGDECRGKVDSLAVCVCRRYRPKRAVIRRTPIERRSAGTKRKVRPRCKHCGHRYGHHSYGAAPSKPACLRCLVCNGYEPARGIRQKRRTPAAALKRIADDLWSQVVKSGRSQDAAMAYAGCEVQLFYPHACVGGLQAMHGIPRTFAATRHLPINGFSGCAGIHKYFTHRPEMWSAMLLFAWGEPTFRELWSIARSMRPVDMDATILSLRAELAKVSA